MTIAPAAGWKKLLGGRRSEETIPTVDYYFLAAMGDLVRAANDSSNRPITRRGPTTFATHRRLVILRYVTREELAWINAQAFDQIFYVVDDMLPIAGQCHELPLAYRSKLEAFAREMLPTILALNPVIVAPSEAILALFPDHRGELIDPCCLQVAGEFSHFGSAGSPPYPFRIAFFGTRSHGAGIEFLTPIIESTLRSRTDVQCTLFLGRHAPKRLRALAGIENRASLSWEMFKQFTACERFHMVLAPLPDTPFNRGRSLTKLMDTAAVGAAGLFSARGQFSRAITHDHDGLLLRDDPALWRSQIERLVVNPGAARVLAENAVATARRLGEKRHLRLFWSERLGI